MNTGKGKYGTRQSLWLKLLDRDLINAAARAVLVAQYGPTMEDEIHDYEVEPLVFSRLANAKYDAFDLDVVVICSEGVGWEADEYGLYALPVRRKSDFALSRVMVSGSVIASCVSDDMVDLADFISVFGDRLEDNYSLWYSKLTDTSKVVMR